MYKVTVTFNVFIGDVTVESAQAFVDEIVTAYGASRAAAVTVTAVEEVTETPVDA